MDLWDRFLWLAIGCFIGFVLGYIVRSLQDIKERVEHVEETVTEHDSSEKSKWDRSDEGLIRHPLLLDLVLLLVVAVTAYAAFSTAKVNDELQHLVDCNTEHNYEQSVALRARDAAISDGTDSEIALWNRYDRLYKRAQEHPEKIPKMQKKLYRAITKHRKLLVEIQVTRNKYDYSNPNVLEGCEGEFR